MTNIAQVYGVSHPDAELLSLASQAQRAFRDDDGVSGASLSALLAPRPWEFPVRQAVSLRAKTEEGRRAKADLIRFILCYGTNDLPQWANTTEHLMLSLCQDMAAAS